MPTKHTELFNEDGEDLGMEATVNLEDGNKIGQDYEIDNTPGVFVRITGHFRRLPGYLRTIWRRVTGG